MTVATNALLEERGARTALLTTEGFTDVLEIARQTRPELYRPCRARPAPLVPARAATSPWRSACGPAACCARSTSAALGEAVARLRDRRSTPLRSACSTPTRTPSTSGASSRAVQDALPGVHVSASHELVSVFREYERTSTTVIDAYLSPLLRGYLERLAERALPRPGCPSPRSCGRAAA